MPERFFDERLSCRENCSSLVIHFCQPTVPFSESELNLKRVSISLPFHRLRLLARERLTQRERDIYWLIVFRLGARDVTRQSSNCTTRGRHQKFFAGGHPRCVQ